MFYNCKNSVPNSILILQPIDSYIKIKQGLGIMLNPLKTNHKKTSVLFFITIVILVIFCLSVPAQEVINNNNESMYGTVKGTVLDSESEKPIYLASVNISYHGQTRTTYTDSNGLYKFEDVPICFCLKNITASKVGYISQYKLVAVSEVTYVNFSLESLDEDDIDEPEIPENPDDSADELYGKVIGWITEDESKAIISDATIIISYHDVSKKTKSYSEGYYEFNGIPICFCLKNITVTKEGYIPETVWVGVSKVTIVNITIMPINASPQNNSVSEPGNDAEDEHPNSAKPGINHNDEQNDEERALASQENEVENSSLVISWQLVFVLISIFALIIVVITLVSRYLQRVLKEI
jgi:hypothetical protein